MARRKTSRQIAASRRNIKKAQAASARKRRKRLAIAGSAILAAGIGGAIMGRSITRKRAYNKEFTGRMNRIKELRPEAYRRVITRRNIRRAQARDDIPLYNPKANKNWPHVDSKKSKKANSKLRKKGMIA